MMIVCSCKLNNYREKGIHSAQNEPGDQYLKNGQVKKCKQSKMMIPRSQLSVCIRHRQTNHSPTRALLSSSYRSTAAIHAALLLLLLGLFQEIDFRRKQQVGFYDGHESSIGSAEAATTTGARLQQQQQQQLQWQGGSGNHQLAPRFALEPPPLVEYQNSSGTVINCRPLPAPEWTQKSGAKLAPATTVTWRLVRRLPGDRSSTNANEELYEDEEQEESIAGGRVRPDGSLQLYPGRAAAASQHWETYKCCLSNRFGRLCSRPVRVRSIVVELASSAPLNLEVFDEFVLAGNSIMLKCQAPGPLGRHLEPVAWLRDDKIIIATATNPLAFSTGDIYQATTSTLNRRRSAGASQIESAKYLMLANGELLVRNASKQDAATYKCRARHLLTGQTVTSRIGGQLMVDDTRVKNELRPQEPSSQFVFSQVDGDALFCAQVQSYPVAKFSWFHRTADGQQPQRLPAEQVPEMKPLGSCLLIRQVQWRHSGTYLCEASNGHSVQRSTFHLLLGTSQLSAQLSLASVQSSQVTGQQMPPRPFVLNPQQSSIYSSNNNNIQLVPFGSTAQLNCSIVGQAYDTIAWFRDAQLIAVSSSSSGAYRSPRIRNPEDGGMSPMWSTKVVRSSSVERDGGQRDGSLVKIVQPNVILIESFGLKDRGMYQCQAYTARLNLSRIIEQSVGLEQSSSMVPTLGSSLTTRLERENLRSASAALQLDVPLVRPTLINRFVSQTVPRGAPLTLECAASALPSALFVWFLDRQPILIASQHHSSAATKMPHYWTLADLLDAAGSATESMESSAEQAASGEWSREDNKATDWWSAMDALEQMNNPAASSDTFDGSSHLTTTPSEPIIDKRFRISTQHLAPSSASGQQQPIVISQLNISQVSAADSGLYKCLAINPLGSVWHAAQVGVQGGGLELRNFQGPNVTLLAGATGWLQCPLVGYPLQRVDWFRGEQRLPVNHRQRIEPIKQGFGGQLEISNVDRAADRGLYTCRASSASSSTSSAERYDDLVGLVNAVVLAPPLIDSQFLPELVQTTEGMRTKLVCSVAAGDRPVEIRWLRRVNEPRARQLTQIGNLRLAGYELMQNSQHAVSAANSDNTELLQQQDSVTIHNLEDSCMLTFKQVSHSDEAEYLCLAQNEAGHSVRHTRLVVHVAPTWSREPPSELGILLGSRLQLECGAHGFPVPQVSWRRESVQSRESHANADSSSPTQPAGSQANADNYIDLVNNYRQRISANGSLTIEQAELADSGAYMCELANGIGTGLSKVIRVRVHVPPYFKQRATPVTQLGQLAGRSELKCLAHGDQPMLIGWRKDADIVDLLNDSRHRVISEHRVPAGGASTGQLALESTLSIQGLMRNDSGQYVCIASNEFGTEESIIQLIVQEPPEAPNLMKPVRATSRQATLSFRPPYSGNSPIRKYAILFKQLPYPDHLLGGAVLMMDLQQQLNASNPLGAGWQQVLVEAPLVTSSFVASTGPMTNDSSSSLAASADTSNPDDSASLAGQLVNLNLCCLEPFARYVVRVRAINEIGHSELSRPVQFSTDEETIGGPPLDVGVEATGAHSLKIRWRAPAKHLQNGLIRGYYIGYRAIGSSQQAQSQTAQRTHVSSSSTAHQVFAGSANSATATTVNEADGEQYQYKNVQLELAGLVAAPGSVTIGPSAEQHASQMSMGAGTNQVPQVFTSYLTNLRRKTTYSIIVQAYNKIGAGPRSDQILVSTLDAAPPISPQLRIMSVTYNSAVLSWSARRRFASVQQQQQQPQEAPIGGNLSVNNIIKVFQNKQLLGDDDLEMDDGEMDDDPQSYYTINFRADSLTSPASSPNLPATDNEPEWQQQRVMRRQSAANYVLSNLRCGSRHTAFMTATNSLGQSEPGEHVKFATLGAAPVAPHNERDLLEVNSTWVLLKLGAWQNAGCLISSFLIKFRPSNQIKWTILEHQVHPTIQTVTIAGSALFSTRPLAGSSAADGSEGLMGAQQVGRNNLALVANKQQSINDLIVRNLLAGTVYKLLVEATSEAGSTLAEYEIDTGNLTSATIAITVTGLSVQERQAAAAAAAAAAAGAARGSRIRLNGGGSSNDDALSDLPSLAPEGSSPTAGGTGAGHLSGLQRYTFGVWSLTILFVVASACMAGTALVLGYRSIMRVKPSRDGLISTLLCCSTNSNSSTAGSSAGDSSNSHASSTAGTCYQVPERSEAAAYLRCAAAAAASQQHLHLSGGGHSQGLYDHHDQSLPLHIQQAMDSLADATSTSMSAGDKYGCRIGTQRPALVSSSSLSTIGGHLMGGSGAQIPRGQQQQPRHTHTLASAAHCQAQLKRRQSSNNPAASGEHLPAQNTDSADHHIRTQYAATLGKQYQHNSSFIHQSSDYQPQQQQPLLKYNIGATEQLGGAPAAIQQQSNVYGRLQNHPGQLSSFQMFQPATASSSGGTTSGYETGHSATMQASNGAPQGQMPGADLDECQSHYLQCLRAENAYQLNLYGMSGVNPIERQQQQDSSYATEEQIGDGVVADQSQQQFHYNVPNTNLGQLNSKDINHHQQQLAGAYGMLFGAQDQSQQ